MKPRRATPRLTGHFEPRALGGWLGAVVFATSMAAQAGEVAVAVAANFAGPLAKIGEAFTAASGHTLKVSSSSTGKFYSQIVAGAPFEVLIAAAKAVIQSYGYGN